MTGYYYGQDIGISELKGKTVTRIEGLEEGSHEVKFVCDDGTEYLMYHSQDCCEHVRILEVIGDISDLTDSEILRADEESNEADQTDPDYVGDSGTWTFYKLATRKGYVDIRWLGESNGYYSESVDFVKVK